jgi:prepilin-type N-terminal cleavage/methylation domain-containing protein
MKKLQRGYTIVELSVAVAIAGVLVVGSIALVQTVLNTSRANDTITGLARVFAQIDKVWSNSMSNNYNGLNVATAGGAGVFEGLTLTRDSTNKVTAVTSKFNRPILLGTATNLPSTNVERGYVLTFTGIPTTVCADIVSSGADSGARGIIIEPEATAGTPVTTYTGTVLGLSTTDQSFTGVPTTAAIAVDAKTAGLQIGNMTGVTGCGTAQKTVSINFINWR